jgi:hypothetical protein
VSRYSSNYTAAHREPSLAETIPFILAFLAGALFLAPIVAYLLTILGGIK